MSAEADEKKTRPLERGSSSGGRKASAAEDASGKIVFHCPNGHRLVVGADAAGKQGKCTKCQVAVTIPRPGGSPPKNALPRPAATSAASDMPAAAKPADTPNPAAPVVEIGIPGLPPASAGEPPDLEALDPLGDGAAEEATWNFIGGEPQPPTAGGFDEGWPAADAGGFGDGDNPTAVLVARLWAELGHGGKIELHLQGGSVILPEWYDANWSRGTHGLFGSQGPDKKVTLTAVAWDTVQKIVVRELDAVPNDMFT